jgi:hypothetical protein
VSSGAGCQHGHGISSWQAWACTCNFSAGTDCNALAIGPNMASCTHVCIWGCCKPPRCAGEGKGPFRMPSALALVPADCRAALCPVPYSVCKSNHTSSSSQRTFTIANAIARPQLWPLRPIIDRWCPWLHSHIPWRFGVKGLGRRTSPRCLLDCTVPSDTQMPQTPAPQQQHTYIHDGKLNIISRPHLWPFWPVID